MVFAVVVGSGCAKQDPVVAPTNQFPEPWARATPPPTVPTPPRTPDAEGDTEVKNDTCDPLRAKVSANNTAPNREDLAICEESVGKLIDALKDSQKALELGILNRDAAVMTSARSRVKNLLEKIPHVTFTVDTQQPLQRLMVTFDGRAVPLDALHKKFSVDPGRHEVAASATDPSGRVLQQTTVLTLSEAQFITVPIRPQ